MNHDFYDLGIEKVGREKEKIGVKKAGAFTLFELGKLRSLLLEKFLVSNESMIPCLIRVLEVSFSVRKCGVNTETLSI
ncbi:hypothetical protein PanWU01x14_140800 [Parasponia andersonii]|uniref:Uncharacterized protein n=1 Tax=Parasponia andersonii TaxID=3476 RepID=A0A2P5CM15_PARAD|nr:hypothetical protein PanWU01x14_140800 [Parasponia andersonii]